MYGNVIACPLSPSLTTFLGSLFVDLLFVMFVWRATSHPSVVWWSCHLPLSWRESEQGGEGGKLLLATSGQYVNPALDVTLMKNLIFIVIGPCLDPKVSREYSRSQNEVSGYSTHNKLVCPYLIVH